MFFLPIKSARKKVYTIYFVQCCCFSSRMRTTYYYNFSRLKKHFVCIVYFRTMEGSTLSIIKRVLSTVPIAKVTNIGNIDTKSDLDAEMFHKDGNEYFRRKMWKQNFEHFLSEMHILLAILYEFYSNIIGLMTRIMFVLVLDKTWIIYNWYVYFCCKNAWMTSH